MKIFKNSGLCSSWLSEFDSDVSCSGLFLGRSRFLAHQPVVQRCWKLAGRQIPAHVPVDVQLYGLEKGR